MQINVKMSNADFSFEIANRYLPIRLSTTYFDGYGECIVIVANRADAMFTHLIEDNDSEVFITLMSRNLYEEMKAKVMGCDYWSPNAYYDTFNGLVDGVQKKIHLDRTVF